MFARSFVFLTTGLLVVASAGVAQAGYQQEVLDLGPLDYWQLEETSTSSSAVDSASDGTPDGTYGSASDPTLAGPTEPGFDSGNSAAGFVEGDSNSHVNMGSGYAPVTNDDARTVLAWINPDTLGQFGDSDNGQQAIATYGSNSGGERFRFQVGPDGDNDSDTSTADELSIDFAGSAVWSTANPIQTGSWQFVAVVFPKADTTLSDVQLFHNGQELTNLGKVSRNSINTTSSMPFKIGQHDGKSFNFDGGIDEVAVFDKKLTGTQIGDLYNAAVIPEPASLALLAPAGLLMLRRRRR